MGVFLSKRHVCTKNKAKILEENRLTYYDTVNTATVCVLGFGGLLR